MPQQVNLKPVNTFNKGLITEATVMTFPEGASSDELNCDLLKNGARQRRRGLAFEDNYQNSSFSVTLGTFVHKQNWSNVSGIGGTEFLVVQVNNMVYFYDKSPAATSTAQKSFSINLYDYDVANSYDAATSPISCSSITGFLVIVSPAIEPLRVEYISSSDTISVSILSLNIRDFEYLGMSANIASISRTSDVVTVNTTFNHSFTPSDTVQIICDIGNFNGTFTVVSAPSSTSFTYAQTGVNVGLTSTSGIATETRFDVNSDLYPSSITSNYQYDLYNMGWAEPGSYRFSGTDYSFPYTGWDATNTDYPPRNKPWFIGTRLNSNGDRVFSEQTFRATTFGKSLAPNGYYILDFFNQNRSAVSGIANLATVTESARFTSTTAFAGRVWYAGLNSQKNGGKIFFSKVVENKDDLSKCYQITSPTTEDTAGVLDSDGGYIIIPDISDIQALYPSGSILYVLASNGVWAIGGVDQVFKATEYYVSKISNFGIISQRTLSDVSGTPIYWGVSAIYAITIEGDRPSVTSISENIKTLYDSIPNATKQSATSVFDRLNNRIYWMYSDTNEVIAHKKNKILVLDMTLQAFFPWAVSDATGSTPYILDAFFLSGLGSSSSNFNVLVGVDQVIDASSNTVVQELEGFLTTPTEIKFIVRTSSGNLTFAEFTNRSFLDWGSANYSSYAETGYDFFGSATIKKNAPYITTYLKRTEQNFILQGNDYYPDYPSGCIFTVKWDLSVDSSRWSNPSQLYRLQHTIVDPNNLTFNYPYDTIVCRTKIRGKGRVLRMRFESEQGKDMYLIGWEIVSGSNPRY